MGNIFAKKAVQERLPTLYLVQGEMGQGQPIQMMIVRSKGDCPKCPPRELTPHEKRCIGDDAL